MSTAAERLQRKAIRGLAEHLYVPRELLMQPRPPRPTELRHARPAARKPRTLGYPDEKYARRRKARERDRELAGWVEAAEQTRSLLGLSSVS